LATPKNIKLCSKSELGGFGAAKNIELVENTNYEKPRMGLFYLLLQKIE